MCLQMSNDQMLFPRLRFLLSRASGLSGCVCLWLAVLAVPVQAESLEKAIEAYDFKEYQEAAQWLRPWAEKGEVEAQYRFGTLYENGQGVVKNLEEAKRWYRNAAAQGHVRARRRLEALEGRPARSGSETVAIKWYQDLAEQGDADAQYNLAFMYETGFSVPKDSGKAAHWYDLAAEKKHVLAQMRLGLMYLAGAGVKQSEIQAAKLLSDAGEHGNKLAAGVNELLLGAAGKELPLNQSEIADKLLGFSAKDEKRALAFLNASVQEARIAQERERATRDAQLAKGKGIKSALEQDTSVEFGLDAQGRRTIKWYQHQAERGLATAQFQLAKYYELGIETPVDMKEAVRWYRSAAELEYPEAQYYFAMLNYYAIGVDRNEVLAQSLIESAAQQGHPAAKRALNGAGSGIARQSMAVWWLTRSGQEKNALAMRQVGNLYELGRGAHADLNEARKYYQAATVLGLGAVAQAVAPSTQRVAVNPAVNEQVKEKEGPAKGQVSAKSTQDTSAPAPPGIQSKLTTWFAQPWVKYSVFALVALVPISAFFWVALKEKRRLTESKKKTRSRPAVV